MANFNSVQMVKRAAGKLVDPNESFGGRLRVAYASYTAPGTGMPAATDTVTFLTLPKGARVLGGKLIWEAQASTATMSIGIAGTVAKYCAAQTMTSAGVKEFPTLYAEFGLALTAEETIIGTLATAGMAASASIAVCVFYLTD